jgi:hypothetical protein
MASACWSLTSASSQCPASRSSPACRKSSRATANSAALGSFGAEGVADAPEAEAVPAARQQHHRDRERPRPVATSMADRRTATCGPTDPGIRDRKGEASRSHGLGQRESWSSNRKLGALLERARHTEAPAPTTVDSGEPALVARRLRLRPSVASSCGDSKRPGRRRRASERLCRIGVSSANARA